MKADFFEIYELVYPEMFKTWGEKAWQFINPSLIKVQDELRRQINETLYVNTYNWGGDREFSGLRPFNSSVGAKLSIHKFGSATDSIASTKSADELREIILNKFELFRGIGCLEIGINWLHMDVRNNVNDEVLFINSKGKSIGYVNKDQIINNKKHVHFLIDGQINKFVEATE